MKSIIFNEQMVRAWTDGTKTITRRMDGLKHVNWRPERWKYDGIYKGDLGKFQKYKGWHKFVAKNETRYARPRYLPGETVYIREAWRTDAAYDPYAPHQIDSGAAVLWIADGSTKLNGPEEWGKVRSPRFMPEWGARSRARIVSVRAERVQEITEEEAAKEGMPHHFNTPDLGCQAIEKFKTLWESIYPGSWDRNDWCWVISLEKLP